METIGFIGGGNMAEAVIKGIITARIYPPENILVSDIKQDRLQYLANTYQLRTTTDNAEVSRTVDILVLSIKPQIMPDALQGIKGNISPDTLIISIAAGILIRKITDVLGHLPVIRVMPNTPALIGTGASGVFANDQAKPMLRKAQRITDAIGITVFVDTEDMIDSITATSGSGPAYFFLLMEEMTKAAVELGFDQDTARKLVIQTAKGAALLADFSDDDPGELRRKVTSPGGTTEAAIKVFNDENFGQIVNKALNRAKQRSIELSK